MYIQIYIPMLYVTRITQNKNDLINSIRQHDRVVNNDCCVVFPTSRFPYLICGPDSATTYLAIRTENNSNI